MVWLLEHLCEVVRSRNTVTGAAQTARDCPGVLFPQFDPTHADKSLSKLTHMCIPFCPILAQSESECVFANGGKWILISRMLRSSDHQNWSARQSTQHWQGLYAVGSEPHVRYVRY